MFRFSFESAFELLDSDVEDEEAEEDEDERLKEGKRERQDMMFCIS